MTEFGEPTFGEALFGEASADTPLAPLTDLPTLHVEMAFKGAADAPEWTDVTDFVMAYSVDRGRNDELARDEAGTATLVLANEDRRFEPEYKGELVNLILNPSNEDWVIDLTGYIAANAGGIYGRQTARGTPGGIVGQYAILVTTLNDFDSGIGYVASGNGPAVTAGLAYTFSLYASGAAGATKGMTLRLIWLNAGGGLVSASDANVTMSASADGWLRYSMTATAPANAASVQLYFLTTTAQGAFDYYVDAWQLEQAAAATAYCDGDQPLCSWEGTPSASVSYRGSYYPNIRPFLRFRIREAWETVTYPVFDGYVEDWEPFWPGGTRADMRIRASDAFLILSRAQLPADWTAPVELTHQRLVRVLDAISWPSADRDIANGHSLMAAVEQAEGNTVALSPLEHMKTVARAEAGRLFVNAAGQVAFQCRHFGTTGANATPRVTFSWQGPAYFSEPLPIFGKTKLYNEVRARTATAQAEHVAQDAAAIARYRQTISLPLDLSPLLDENELDDAAAYWVSIYAWAKLRFQRLTLDPRGAPVALWPQALGRELGDRVQVDVSPPPWDGPVVSQQLFLQGIHHERDVETNTWRTVFALSPFGVDYASGQIWLLDSSGDTLLGTNSELRY